MLNDFINNVQISNRAMDATPEHSKTMAQAIHTI